MTVTINGEHRDVPEGLTVAALLNHLGLLGNRVAIERNLEILPRSLWLDTLIQPNDSFEIVQLVGGG
jgi:thiamine biosynthesis protein ThiS